MSEPQLNSEPKSDLKRHREEDVNPVNGNGTDGKDLDSDRHHGHRRHLIGSISVSNGPTGSTATPINPDTGAGATATAAAIVAARSLSTSAHSTISSSSSPQSQGGSGGATQAGASSTTPAPSTTDAPDSAPTNSKADDHTAEPAEGDNQNTPSYRKRQRVRLSCLECRRRKLSCDRAFPCDRCVKSGTPDRCAYEARPGPPGTVKDGIPQATFAPAYDSRRLSAHEPGTPSGSVVFDGLPTLPKPVDLGLMRLGGGGPDERIRRLESELVQIKSMLARVVAGDAGAATAILANQPQESNVRPEVKDPAHDQPLPREVIMKLVDQKGGEKEELRFFRGKEFRTRYFGPHNACMAFSELTALCPFIKETADEWLRPIRNYDSKDRKKLFEDREKKFFSPDLELDVLVPPREQTDELVSLYLDQFEQVHRIVHIPTFRIQYAKFWETGETRYAAFTALVLSMMAVSICIHSDPPQKVLTPKSACHQKAEKWIWACEDWLSNQSQKHRRLIHYQIACLLYLGKRVNTLKKKRFWTASGALIQDGISVGLHRDPGHMADRITPFNQEMRRRIWATIQEFNMQASFDHGLPTMMSQLHYDVQAPRNLDDNDFGEDTINFPPSKPTKEYTFSSYQHLSRQSLRLRLSLSLTLTGPPEDLDYDQVIRYTNDITQEIDALPSWDVTPSKGPNAKKPLLAYTLLHIQLRQYLIPLHQPYLRLRQKNSKYQYSEIIYYNAARDMVLLHDKLSEQGIRTLYFLREDALTTAINLCSVTMLQPRGSTNMIMINSQHTLQLLEKCLAMKEDRLLRCGNNEPWGYSIMCSAYGLLEAHLGIKTPAEAKSGSVQRFVDLHHKMVGSDGVSRQPQHFQAGFGGQQQQGPGGVGNGMGRTGGHHAGGPLMDASGMPVAKPPTPMSIPNMLGHMVPPVAPPPGVTAAVPWMFAGGPGGHGVAPGGGMMPDLNLEVLGLNLNDLWGDQWDMA